MIIKGNTVGHPLADPRKGLTMVGPINMNGQSLTGLKHPQSDNDAATKKYAESYADSLHKSFTVALAAQNWSEATPYRQTVAAAGILATDTPHWSVVYSADPDLALSEKEAFALVDDLDTEDGSLTFTCFEAVPEVDLNIQLEVNRGAAGAAAAAVAMMNMSRGSDASVQAVIDGVSYNVGNADANSTPTSGSYDFTIL